jgi:hypothetical protein
VKRFALLTLPLFLLAACGGAEQPAAETEASTSSPAAATSAAPQTSVRTTQPAERQEQLFSASMNTLALTPTFGTVEELRTVADTVCANYAAGDSYLEQLNDLVVIGMDVDQATSFEDTAVTIFCPEYLNA